MSSVSILRYMFLAESQESKSIDAAKKLLVSKLNFSPERADEVIRKDLRDGIPALKTKEGGKFILGCTRLFFVDKQLTDATKLDDMNEVISILVDDRALYDKFDRNLNNLSYRDFVKPFDQIRKDRLEKDKKEQDAVDRRQAFKRPSNYDIIYIDSFEEAKKFHKYTDWCITYLPRMWDSYTSDGKNTVYFCVRKDVATVEKPQEGRMLDNYDLSLISVIVGIDGGLRFCTCRHNHDYAPENIADHMLSTKDLSRILRVNFYKTFPNKKAESLREILKNFKKGENLEKCYQELKELYNYVGKPNSDNTLLPVSVKNLEFNVLRILDDQGNFENVFDDPVLDIDGFNDGLCMIYKPADGHDPEDYAEPEDDEEETYQGDFGYDINILREDGTFVFKKDFKNVSWEHAQDLYRAAKGDTAFIKSDNAWYCVRPGKISPVDSKADNLDCQIRDVSRIDLKKYGAARVKAYINKMTYRYCTFLVDSTGSRISDFFAEINSIGGNIRDYLCGKTHKGESYLIDTKTGKAINSTPLGSICDEDKEGKYLGTITSSSPDRSTYNTLIKIEKTGSGKSFSILPYSKHMWGREVKQLGYGDYEIYIDTDTGKEWVEKDGEAVNIDVPWKDLRSSF